MDDPCQPAEYFPAVAGRRAFDLGQACRIARGNKTPCAAGRTSRRWNRHRHRVADAAHGCPAGAAEALALSGGTSAPDRLAGPGLAPPETRRAKRLAGSSLSTLEEDPAGTAGEAMGAAGTAAGWAVGSGIPAGTACPGLAAGFADCRRDCQSRLLRARVASLSGCSNSLSRAVPAPVPRSNLHRVCLKVSGGLSRKKSFFPQAVWHPIRWAGRDITPANRRRVNRLVRNTVGWPGRFPGHVLQSARHGFGGFRCRSGGKRALGRTGQKRTAYPATHPGSSRPRIYSPLPVVCRLRSSRDWLSAPAAARMAKVSDPDVW